MAESLLSAACFEPNTFTDFLAQPHIVTARAKPSETHDERGRFASGEARGWRSCPGLSSPHGRDPGL